jgi:PAS domain S-box-containing protein
LQPFGNSANAQQKAAKSECALSSISVPMAPVSWSGESEGMSAQISQIQLCTLLESLPEAVFIVDREGRLLEANTPAERLLGRPRAQLRGMSAEDLQKDPHSSRQGKVVPIRRDGNRLLEAAASAVGRALGGQRVRNERCVVQFADQGDEGQLEALVSANPIVDPRDGVLGALVVFRDVTEINQLQRRLAGSERDHAVGQMAAGLIHDFNNVLDTLDQAVTVMELREGATRGQQLAYMGMMHRAIRRGSEIVGRLRQYLRSGSGVTEPLDLHDLLADTLEMARPMLQSSHRNVRLSEHIQPVGRVRGNASDLRRVFTNLILNALQAMPQGGELEVRCEAVSGAGGEARARVVVCDTGGGIPAEAQKKIFRPYFTTKPAGTGLGLSEAQRIVHSIGGRIFFHTEAGKGTRFNVDLPLVADSGSSDGGERKREYRGNRSQGSGKLAVGGERPPSHHTA